MFHVVIEVLESAGIGICLILAAPLSFFKRLNHLCLLIEYTPLLMRHSLFAALLRARLDFKMGNYQQSAVLLDPIITELERLVKADPSVSPRVKHLLCTLYCDVQQLQLLSGQVEDAVLVVLRAHQHLGLDRLPSNPDFDLKTAHVIKAGLAASKLLEEGGLATLMVRQGEEPIVSRPRQQSKDPFVPPPKRRDDDTSAVIIPFPLRP